MIYEKISPAIIYKRCKRKFLHKLDDGNFGFYGGVGNSESFSPRKAAFTLAEVLITLGIIGVVAAMTLPALIQKHNNTVVETRLKKFYTTFNQAIQLAESKYGDKKDWYLDASGVELDEEGNPIAETAEIDKWFEKYLSTFIVLKKKVTHEGYVIYYLPDGSAFQLGTSNLDNSMRDIVFYTGNPDKCNALPNPAGICRFTFEYYPVSKRADWKYHYNKGLEPAKYNWDGTEEDLKTDSARGCYINVSDGGKRPYCTALIQLNGWKIPDDYPYKVRY